MRLPNFTKNSLTNPVNTVYKNLYEVIYISDFQINETIYETFNFKIDGDLCICQMHDAYNIKIELFKEVSYVIATCFDNTGSVVKFMKIKVNLDKVLYELKWTSTALSEITVNFNIEKIETYTTEDNISIDSVVKETIRELKLDNILK